MLTVAGRVCYCVANRRGRYSRSTVLTDPDNINNARTYVLHSTYRAPINAADTFTKPQ